MVTADQIVCHLVGDYLLQSDWMAGEKTKKSIAALAHVLTYGLAFLFLKPSWAALTVIVASHFVIDRWRLARFVCWAKNFLSPRETYMTVEIPVDEKTVGVIFDGLSSRVVGEAFADPSANSSNFTHHREPVRWWRPWAECSKTGYHESRPDWMGVWLLIIADNVMHLICNALALAYL